MKSMTKRPSFWLTAALLVSFVPAGCLFSGHKKTAAKTQSNSAEPDKILYDRALNDYQHGRYTEARLSLQTLINSYPDSEYLAKAKLAVADSYYKEGGTEGLTQAVAEYKDFITFFPFLENEASYAQMQVGMAHYRMMEKPDRDPTQARFAEQEFQTFLLKYPKNPLVPQADQRLRDVQEVLGGGDFEVAHFYYVKGDYRAAAARLIEVANRYPLFSQADRAHWMLGDIFQRAARGSKNEQERALWRTRADVEYAKLVREYPLSPLASEAKRRLEQDSAKIPPPDPDALARAKYEEKYARNHLGLVRRAEGVIKTGPDVSMAAHTGAPDLNPPEEIESPQSVFQPASSDASGANPTGQMSIQAVSPESATPPPANAAPPTDPTTSSTTDSSTPPATVDAVPPSPTNTTAATPTATDAEAAHVSATTKATAKAPTKANDKPADTTATATDQQAAAAPAKKSSKSKANKSKESSSKRKRGLKKLIPW